MNVKNKILNSGLIDIISKKLAEHANIKEEYVKIYFEKKLEESINDIGNIMSNKSLEESNISKQKEEISNPDIQDLIDKGYKLLKEE